MSVGQSDGHSPLHVAKFHGWGNDFLVVDVTDPDVVPKHVSRSDLARTLCERRTGIGADGLLFLEICADSNLSMGLFNADGSTAEMSGNGIRCLVHAAHRSIHHDYEPIEWPVRYTVSTDAGTKIVDVLRPEVDGILSLSVDMGTVEDIDAPKNWDSVGCHKDRPVRHVSVGNPHSVVGVDDVDAVDIEALGRVVPEINLEIVEPGPEPDAVTMRVHERGAGTTMACGTGACAVADAALSWGLVPRSTGEVRVHMPGGEALVRIDADSRRAILIGPSEFVARVTVFV